jgi:hypothetical protein
MEGMRKSKVKASYPCNMLYRPILFCDIKAQLYQYPMTLLAIEHFGL